MARYGRTPREARGSVNDHGNVRLDLLESANARRSIRLDLPEVANARRGIWPDLPELAALRRGVRLDLPELAALRRGVRLDLPELAALRRGVWLDLPELAKERWQVELDLSEGGAACPQGQGEGTEPGQAALCVERCGRRGNACEPCALRWHVRRGRTFAQGVGAFKARAVQEGWGRAFPRNARVTLRLTSALALRYW